MWLASAIVVELFWMQFVLSLTDRLQSIVKTTGMEQLQILYSGSVRSMKRHDHNIWQYDLMTELPSVFQIVAPSLDAIWNSDLVSISGNADGNATLDAASQISCLRDSVKVDEYPESPYLAYKITVDDANLRFTFEPVGSRQYQVVVYFLLAFVPLITSFAGIWIYLSAFYGVKFNRLGEIQDYITPVTIQSNPYTRQAETNLETMESGRLSCSQSPEKESAVLPSTMTTSHRRTVLIATIEYRIRDWNIQVEVGGLGATAELMGKYLEHQDFVWVLPCVGGIDYPNDRWAKPMTATILDVQYIVHVQYHRLRNITFVLLDAPFFRAQKKAEPYPRRKDDIDSAVYYSTWNSCIAEAIRRFPVDIYHMNDFHGTIAPLHLLPRILPCRLSLYNAELQGLWPIRTPQQKRKLCGIFNLGPNFVREYVQFEEFFNILHGGVNYPRVWQNGFGVVTVSAKYAVRSLARYPIFWGLKKIGSLPSPDPIMTGGANSDSYFCLAEQPNFNNDAKYNRPALKSDAQEWAHLDNNPEAELFIFVGGWSIQQGFDLVADVFLAILEQHPKAQLICIGPIVDLYGKLAALKLEKITFLYPRRVCSRPGSIVLPPKLIGRVDFALIPSRDEPLNSVAVEYGRRGALGVGSRAGGYGSMPVWWFTIESTLSRHIIKQFKTAIEAALASNIQLREEMRSVSAKQRVSVAQWRTDFCVLQDTTVQVSQIKGSKGGVGLAQIASEDQADFGMNQYLLCENREPQYVCKPYTLTDDVLSISGISSRAPFSAYEKFSTHVEVLAELASLRDDSESTFSNLSRTSLCPHVSLKNLSRGKTNYRPQNPKPFFTDSTGLYSNIFKKNLQSLNAQYSEGHFCIEEYLAQRGKDWYDCYWGSKMERSNKSNSNLPSIQAKDDDQLYKGLKCRLVQRIGDWPLYSLLLAFGQIIAASSYQISLLTDEVDLSNVRFYVINTVYLVTTAFWWMLFRRFKSVYVLSVPFGLYGLAFFLIGVAPYARSEYATSWIRKFATGCYAAASSSRGFYFSLNFGNDRDVPAATWSFRACIIEGSQQIYVAMLWFWGSRLTELPILEISQSTSAAYLSVFTRMATPIAFLMWIIGLVAYLGLPDFYRQAPGQISPFYRSIHRRKIIVWYFIMVMVQSYFLSASYGRNWTYLWSSQHAPKWAIVFLIMIFFLAVWAASLQFFGNLSKWHSWILPIFAVGLGVPRWAQILWATSGVGFWIPWAGSSVAGALVGRVLWLWLGVLDAIQGVGFGMILMQTLTRLHITFTMALSQILGSLAAMVARASMPDVNGPSSVFPNFALKGTQGLKSAWFWISLMLQLSVCIGFFKFYGKEQLRKPRNIGNSMFS